MSTTTPLCQCCHEPYDRRFGRQKYCRRPACRVRQAEVRRERYKAYNATYRGTHRAELLEKQRHYRPRNKARATARAAYITPHRFRPLRWINGVPPVVMAEARAELERALATTGPFTLIEAKPDDLYTIRFIP